MNWRVKARGHPHYKLQARSASLRPLEWRGGRMTDAVFPGGLGAVSKPGLWRGLAERLAAEDERRFFWLPVFFGAGIGVYFSLKAEPPLWPAIVLAAAAIGLPLVLRR